LEEALRAVSPRTRSGPEPPSLARASHLRDLPKEALGAYVPFYEKAARPPADVPAAPSEGAEGEAPQKWTLSVRRRPRDAAAADARAERGDAWSWRKPWRWRRRDRQ
jgi:hypothetical protein